MKNHLALASVGIVLSLLLTGCALSPKTDVDVLDSKFTNEVGKKVGVIQFDAYTFKPVGTDQTVAMQFGVVGALAWAASENAKNSGDYTVDTEGVRLHRESMTTLHQHLESNASISLAHVTEPSELDPVALSREIRRLRLFGTNAPSPTDVREYAAEHGLDYVLYSASWGGIFEPNDTLVLSTKWRIFDAEGNDAVSVLTRSVYDKIPASTLEGPVVTDQLLELFQENLDKFSDAVDQTEQGTKTGSGETSARMIPLTVVLSPTDHLALR